MSTLLVASGGGHLKQLYELAPRLRGVDEDKIWVTWDAPQSRSLLRGCNVVYVRPTQPRSPFAVASNLDHALRLWYRAGATALVTTGSQLVLPFIAVGRLVGRPCHFVESAARSEGPSLTARMASRIPGVCLYTQYRHWEDARWRYVGSVFDGFSSTAQPVHYTPPLRIVVTLGTMPGLGFRRLVERCLQIFPEDAAVTWQTGSTDVSDLNLPAREFLPSAELEALIQQADVVVSHAGVGSALTTLQCGRCPVLVPRSAAHGEHVDEHQRQVGLELALRNLAVLTDPTRLCLDDLTRAMSIRVLSAPDAEPIVLDGGRCNGKRRPGAGGPR